MKKPDKEQKVTEYSAFGKTKCHYCDGRGFLIIQCTTLEGKILPNLVEDCEWCNETGVLDRT